MRSSRTWILVIAIGLIACLHAWFGFKGFAHDSAFVAYRIADNFAAGHGLTWNPGQPPVEKTTSAAWIALMAAAGTIGMEPIRAARLLGYLGLFLATLAVSVDPRSLRPVVVRAAVAGGFLAVSGNLCAWAMAGTELALLPGLVALSLLATVRLAHDDSPSNRALAAASLTLVALSTADAYVIVLALLGFGAIATRSSGRWLAAGVVPLLVLAAGFGFRFATYGHLLPGTYPADLGPGRAVEGLRWLGTALAVHVGLVVAALTVLRHRDGSPGVWIPAGLAVAWAVHIALLGGGSGPGWPPMVVALIPLAWLAAEGLSGGLSQGPALVLPAAGLLLLHGIVLNSRTELIDARASRSIWYAPPTAHILKTAFADRDPLLAVEAPGVLPYWTGFRAVDLAVEEDAWELAPDLLVLGTELGGRRAATAAGRQLRKRPEFDEYYQPVVISARSVLVGRAEHTWWVRREGGALGARRGPDQVWIPGWFLAAPGSVAARWSKQTLAAPVTADWTSEVPDLLLRAGTWVVDVPEGVVTDFRCEGVGASITGPGPAVLNITNPQHIDILAWAAGESLPVTELTVRLTDQEPTRACDPIPQVPWSSLPRQAEEGAPWSAPGSVRFGADGMRVLLEAPVSPGQLAIALDGNDRYLVTWFAGTELAGKSPIHQGASGGLQTRVVPIPKRAVSKGADRLAITPVDGDGTYSLGAAQLIIFER